MERAPHLIPDIALEDILDRSKADALTKGLLIVQVLWFCLNSIIRLAEGLSLSLLEISTLAHALCAILTYLMWWSKPKDVEWQTVITGDGARELGAWMSIASPPRRIYLLFLGCQGQPESTFLPDYDPPARPPSQRGVDGWETPSRMLNKWKTRFLFRHRRLPWYITEEESVGRRQSRWDLASDAFSMFNLDPMSHRRFSRRPYLQATATLHSFGRSLHVGDLQESESFNLSNNRAGSFAIGILIGSMTIYGLPHLLAWLVPFPSVVERLLWRVATFSITFLGMTYGIIVVSAALVSSLIDCYTSTSTSWNIDDILNPPLTCWYILCSTYLAVSSIRQLSALPPDAFKLPSWGNYWPHLS